MVTITKNIALADAATSTQTGGVGEPSAAASRTGMFVTGNWYASRSTDAGATWQFIDPFTEFPRNRGEFCCDQIVVWAPSQRLWIWLLQYSATSAGTNIFRVAVSRDTAPGTWHSWDVSPTDIDASWKSWFDYPDMAISEKHLWISFNQYDTQDRWVRANVFRYELDALDDVVRGNTGALTRQQWTTTDHGSLKFVVGAGETMWWASNDVDADAVHVFAWPDATAAVESWAVKVSPWNGGDYSSAGPGNVPWLDRADDRVTAGWRRGATGDGSTGAQLGWLWTAGRGPGRPQPYVRAVTISEDTLHVVVEPDLWSANGAWAYPTAAPSGRGRIGMAAFFGGGATHPAHSVGALDPAGKAWTMKRTAVSTHGPRDGKWGDYLTIRPHPTRPTSWVASGFTLQGGQDRRNIEPRVVVFRP